jgi:hypothetical protein
MMDEEDDELRDRFFRKRRLLLGVSVTDTLGLHFEIEDPSKLWWAL